MSLFGWVDVALAIGAVLCGLGLCALYVRALFKRHKPHGETYVRWPRWLPHVHDWQERLGWFGPSGENEVHESCMRCRRQRNSRTERRAAHYTERER